MDWKEVRARDYLRRRWAIDEAKKKVLQDEEAKRRNNPSEDTKTRLEIQKFIRGSYSKGKRSKAEILEQLNATYGDFKYLKYQRFFESWVNNFLGIKDEKNGEAEAQNVDNKPENKAKESDENIR